MVLRSIGLTGASGMLGRQIMKAAAQREIVCRTTSRTAPAGLRSVDSWQSWDLTHWREWHELDALFPNIDVVVHAGAIVAPQRASGLKDMVDANVRACVCIGDWAKERGIPFVYISGATVYAIPTGPAISEDDPKTNGDAVGGFYGLSKFLGELVLGQLRACGLKLLVLRPASIYGPGLHAGKLVRDFLDRALRGACISVPRSNDRYNLVHAYDVAIALFDALAKDAFGVFNIGGELISAAELARRCVEVARSGSVQLVHEPNALVRTLFDLDCSAAAASFGYRPRVSVAAGLLTMIDEV